MTASPKRVSVSTRELRAAKAAFCWLEGAFTGTGKMSRGVKIDMKLPTAGPDASASLLAELAASWTAARAAAFKLPAVTGVTPEPASVRAIVATAESARPRRRRRVRVFVRSIAVAFRDGQSWCGASLTTQLCNPPVAWRLHLRVHLQRKRIPLHRFDEKALGRISSPGCFGRRRRTTARPVWREPM